MFFLLNNINHIGENLFMGEPPTDEQVVKYKYIICLNGKPSYYTPHKTFIVCYPFDDVEQIPPENDIHELAKMAAQLVKWALLSFIAVLVSIGQGWFQLSL